MKLKLDVRLPEPEFENKRDLYGILREFLGLDNKIKNCFVNFSCSLAQDIISWFGILAFNQGRKLLEKKKMKIHSVEATNMEKTTYMITSKSFYVKRIKAI